MAASNNTGTGNGRTLYYSVSYGKLSTRQKEVPENSTEIAEADLKAKIQNVEQIDLRNKYINKGTGDYPYVVFYDSLTGVITAQEQKSNEHGTFLNLTILDTDGDTSILQANMYSKYAEDLLNRLLNVPAGAEITFTPYQMPSIFEVDGKNKAYYNQGVSLKVNGQKVERKYDGESTELPKTVQIKVQGKNQTSRDERVDFLYNKFSQSFTPADASSAPAPQQQTEQPKEDKKPWQKEEAPASSIVHDDLPFG